MLFFTRLWIASYAQISFANWNEKSVAGHRRTADLDWTMIIFVYKGTVQYFNESVAGWYEHQ